MGTTTPRPLPRHDGTVYLVLDDFGQFGTAYRETDPAAADRKTGEVARELLARAAELDPDLDAVRDLVERAP